MTHASPLSAATDVSLPNPVRPTTDMRTEHTSWGDGGGSEVGSALTMTWSHPDFWSMFATSFAVMGARLLSFLSCRAYG